MKARLLAAALVFLGSGALRGQEEAWEELIDPETAEERVESLIEFLEWREGHPLDINRARAGDWLEFPWIDTATASALVAARHASGGFRRVSDLQAIPELDEAEYRRLLPYLSCPLPGGRRKALSLEGRHRWTLARPQEAGAALYAGSAARLYQRLRFRMGQTFSGGMLCEKDPGEKSPADLFRGGLLVEMPWLSSRLCLGSLRIESGRGLLFSGRTAWGSGTDPVAGFRPHALQLRPSLSAGENGGLDGAALTIGGWSNELLLFAGHASWDATLEGECIRALQWSGLHRSAAEQAARGALHASSYGLRLQRRFGGRLRLAAAWQEAHYSRAFAVDPALEKRHAFSGRRNWNKGLEAELHLSSMTGFAEAALCRSGGAALEAGALLHGRWGEGLLLFHRHGAAYHRLLGASDEELRNTTGGRLALRFDLPRRIRLAAACEIGRNLAPAWRQPMPAIPTTCYTLTLSWQPLPALTCLHQLRCKENTLIEATEDGFGNDIKGWCSRRLWSAASQLEYQTGRMRWRTRLEYRRFRIAAKGLARLAAPDSSGWMLYQQLGFTLGRGLALVARYQFFDARSYEIRMYIYENDLPGALALPLNYGRGCRAFLLLQCRLATALQLSARWSWQPSEPEGTGQKLRRIAARQSLGAQLDWRLPGR